ncbi:MAG: hypothetical protein ACPF87_06650, partial [Flavobacteriales bacterium]
MSSSMGGWGQTQLSNSISKEGNEGAFQELGCVQNAWATQDTLFHVGALPSSARMDVCVEIDAGNDETICLGECLTFEADYDPIHASNTYVVEPLGFELVAPLNAGTVIPSGTDDTWSQVISIPFDFCFFGNTYSSLIVGSNGVVSFNTLLAGTGCAWQFANPLPSATVPYPNSINGAYHDIDPSVGGELRFAVVGEYPCRKFVISFFNVPHYQCNNLLTNQQIVLHEMTNEVDVFIQDKPTCSTWNSGNAVIGIQNEAGNVAFVPPGRNTGPWSASSEGWKFKPNGAELTSVSWTDANGNALGSGPSVDWCPSEPGAITATATHPLCGGGSYSVSDEALVAFGSDCFGCPDPGACNYDPTAIPDNSLCDYACLGCTDPLACNFDENATIDDGSCT